MTAEDVQVVENEEAEEIQLYNIPGSRIFQKTF
jgi:hypothetical protein